MDIKEALRFLMHVAQGGVRSRHQLKEALQVANKFLNEEVVIEDTGKPVKRKKSKADELTPAE